MNMKTFKSLILNDIKIKELLTYCKKQIVIEDYGNSFEVKIFDDHDSLEQSSKLTIDFEKGNGEFNKVYYYRLVTAVQLIIFDRLLRPFRVGVRK